MRKSSEGELAARLARLDGRPYGYYKDMLGTSFATPWGCWRFDGVQGDPFAAPSRLRLELPPELLGLPELALASRDSRRACSDHLHRALRGLLVQRGEARLGSGKSGLLEIAPLGPEVLERTAVQVRDDASITLRLQVGLPARGRRILARAAERILLERLPQVLERLSRELDPERLRAHVECVEDQVALRAALDSQGLVAFLADESVLPRGSGVSSLPLAGARRLLAPESLRVVLEAPHAGPIAGLGIPTGVTLIVGGGYHGKSTLLATLGECVFDHVPGDGRERCVTAAATVSIRAEDGRAVRGCDVRPFIGRLPLDRDRERFDTEDASGSTSQAAAIIEALEVGARALLIDEDTAATNFMLRDARMRSLVPADKEPIVPYLDRVRELHAQRQVSSVLVVGGSGEYLDVVDRVIQMDTYQPLDVTARAREVAAALPLGASAPRVPEAWPAARPRVPDPRAFDPRRGRRAERVRAVRTRAIEFGGDEIDVSALSQLIDASQCRFIGDVLLAFSRGLCDGERSVANLLDLVEAELERTGIEAFAEFGFGDRALARRFEIAAALNRMRSLRIRCE